MPLFLRVHPGGRQYRLPDGEDAGEMTRGLAEVLGKRGCVVLGYELPEQPRSTAVVLINGNVVGCVELVDAPQEPRSG
jgi:predicted amidohydrolase